MKMMIPSLYLLAFIQLSVCSHGNGGGGGAEMPTLDSLGNQYARLVNSLLHLNLGNHIGGDHHVHGEHHNNRGDDSTTQSDGDLSSTTPVYPGGVPPGYKPHPLMQYVCDDITSPLGMRALCVILQTQCDVPPNWGSKDWSTPFRDGRQSPSNHSNGKFDCQNTVMQAFRQPHRCQSTVTGEYGDCFICDSAADDSSTSVCHESSTGTMSPLQSSDTTGDLPLRTSTLMVSTTSLPPDTTPTTPTTTEEQQLLTTSATPKPTTPTTEAVVDTNDAIPVIGVTVAGASLVGIIITICYAQHMCVNSRQKPNAPGRAWTTSFRPGDSDGGGGLLAVQSDSTAVAVFNLCKDPSGNHSSRPTSNRASVPYAEDLMMVNMDDRSVLSSEVSLPSTFWPTGMGGSADTQSSVPRL